MKITITIELPDNPDSIMPHEAAALADAMQHDMRERYAPGTYYAGNANGKLVHHHIPEGIVIKVEE